MKISGICEKGSHGYYKGSNCPNCDPIAVSSKWTTNLFMRTERGKRSDIEFSNLSMDESIKQWNK